MRLHFSMKILQLINSLYIGGAEKLIVDTVPALQNQGIEVDVLCLKKDRTSFWKNLEKESNGSIEGLTEGSLYNPLLIFKLIPFLKRYNVIHVHLFPALYWVILAKWLSFSSVKIIVTEHNTKNRRMQKGCYRLVDRFFHRGVIRVVTISDQGMYDVKKHLSNLPTERFKLIYNGINIKKYTTAVPYSRNTFFKEEDFVVTQVSNFRKQKDHTTLIRALAEVPEVVKLILVGEGKLKKESEKLVHQLNLEHRVLFLGARTDVERIVKTSDVIVLSSAHEGFGLAIVEGMAAQKPCIASRIGGLSEIVDGYGLLFQVGNTKELASHIVQLYTNNELYSQVADKCYERAQQFDVNKMVDLYLELYKEVIKEKH